MTDNCKLMRSGLFLGLIFTIAFCGLVFSSCSGLVKKATSPLIDNLSTAIMKQKDLDLVRDGAPTFLLMIDSFVEGSPNDPEVLQKAANLYSAYLSAFVAGKDDERAKLMSEKARNFAFRAAALRNPNFTAIADLPYDQFISIIPTFEKQDTELVFLLISTWAAYISAHADKVDNLADIAKVQALAERLLELDETYYYGAGHLAMGTLFTLMPKALGGKPEQAKVHFERAIEISDGKFLPAYVMYAEKYAKLTFDRELHDRLLKNVLDTPVDIVPELTLINAVAQRQAKALMADADDYF